MISKTKIKERASKKGNPEVKGLVDAMKKSKFWMEVAYYMTRPTRELIEINVGELNEMTKDGEVIVVPGKILAEGEMDHKLTLSAFKMSEKAKEKMKGCKIVPVAEMIKQNKDGKGMRILNGK